MAIGVALIVALTVASIGVNGAPSAAGIGVFITDGLHAIKHCFERSAEGGVCYAFSRYSGWRNSTSILGVSGLAPIAQFRRLSDRLQSDLAIQS
jgi:hypothetical protein